MIKEYIAYLRDNPHGYWFRAKLYGYGWVPARWQGWVTVLVYLIVVTGLLRYFDSRSHSGSDTLINFAIPFIFLTLILIAICRIKGERPRWNWGPSKDTTKK